MCISQPDSYSCRISICSTKELQHTLHVASRKRDSSFFGYSELSKEISGLKEGCWMSTMCKCDTFAVVEKLCV
jgi:hypothetical protein